MFSTCEVVSSRFSVTFGVLHNPKIRDKLTVRYSLRVIVYLSLFSVYKVTWCNIIMPLRGNFVAFAVSL